MSKKAKVVIIGGGVNGASIAYHLAKRGYQGVVLLEKDTICSGSTSKSGGIIRQHYSNEITVRMAQWSRKFFERFQGEVGGEPEFVQNGFLVLSTVDEEKPLLKNIRLQRSLGIEVDTIALEEVQKLLPFLSLEGITMASLEKSACYADPYGVTMGFAQKARQLGVEVYEQTEALGLALKGNRVEAVLTNKGEIETPRVVNAGGPWAAQVGQWAGLELPITLFRLQEAVVKPLIGYSRTTPTIHDMENAIYFRPESGGLVLAGMGVEEGQEPITTKRRGDLEYNEKVDATFVEQVSEKLSRRIPSFIEASFVRGWAGLIDVTPDFHPILGQVPEVEGFYCATGFSGHGFKLAPAVGHMMAELIIEGNSSDLDISAFSLERFKTGRVFTSSYPQAPILA